MDTAQEGPKEGPFSITFNALHLSSQSHHHFATQDMFPYNWVLNFTSKNYPWSRLFGVFVPSSEFFQQHARPSVIQKKNRPANGAENVPCPHQPVSCCDTCTPSSWRASGTSGRACSSRWEMCRRGGRCGTDAWWNVCPVNIGIEDAPMKSRDFYMNMGYIYIYNEI